MSEFAEIFAADHGDGERERAWSAVARVADEDPVHVVTDDAGKVLGVAVTCTIVDGPFVGAEVAAKLAAPIGSGLPSTPSPGDTLLLALTHGTLDGPIIATHAIPGGAERPMPAAYAGVPLTPEGLAKSVVTAPPKGVGVRFYVRGAPFLIRLKGKQDDFASEFYVEADDGAFIRLIWNKDAGSFGIKMQDAKGAYISIADGAVTISSPSGENFYQVSDDGILESGTAVTRQATVARLGGLYMFNMPPGSPPLPAAAALRGVAGVSGLPSLGVFIGL